MISVAEADRRLAALVPASAVERVPLAQARGRVLSEAVTTDRPGPPYDRVAMDGYAVVARPGVRSWTVEGLQKAGHPPLTLADPSRAVEVATGAVLPLGCDTVIPYEATQRQGDRMNLLADEADLTPGRHVHRSGTDYATGAVLFEAGTVLRSAHFHGLATVGAASVAVVRRPRWALAVTGDELVEVDQVPEAWQIRRSNAAAIAAEAGAWGLGSAAEAVLPDDAEGLRTRLATLMPGVDALVLTGGVSAGVVDLVPRVLGELGAQVHFHKVAQRPGKPLWVGTIARPEGPLTVFGLPGNPVSSLFSFRRYVLPWLLAAEGRPMVVPRVKVPGLSPPPAGTTVFLPWSQATGLVPWTGSGDVATLARSTGFLELNDDPLSWVEPLYHRWGGEP